MSRRLRVGRIVRAGVGVVDVDDAEIVFSEGIIRWCERVEVLDGCERLIDKGGPAALDASGDLEVTRSERHSAPERVVELANATDDGLSVGHGTMLRLVRGGPIGSPLAFCAR